MYSCVYVYAKKKYCLTISAKINHMSAVLMTGYFYQRFVLALVLYICLQAILYVSTTLHLGVGVYYTNHYYPIAFDDS